MVKSILIQEQSKVLDFLNSVARNSERTKELYGYGLAHFQTFLSNDDRYSKYTVDNILNPVFNNQINVYTLMDNFVSHLISKHETKLSPSTVSSYVGALRSYFQYHDIDIVSVKFKRRVKLPKNYKEDEEPIDASDIRKILLSCNNRRLKAYLLVLASGGMRTIEAIAIRNSDIDFSVSPTKIHIRSEYAKTKVSRDIYISDEATKFLKEWLDFKYREKGTGKVNLERSPEQLIFGKQNRAKGVIFLYQKLWIEFNKILHTLNMDERKEGMRRRKITLHSFRRYVKTVIANQTSSDYSEWFLGHKKSPYYTIKEAERREIYVAKCMKYLTFLDYSTLEATGRNIESKLEEKDKQIQSMKEHYQTEMREMRDDMDKRLGQIMSMIQQNPQLAQIKPEVLAKKRSQ